MEVLGHPTIIIAGTDFKRARKRSAVNMLKCQTLVVVHTKQHKCNIITVAVYTKP